MCARTSVAIVVLLFAGVVPTQGAEFASQWQDQVDRVWIGPEYWANRLHDWAIRDGQLVCVATAKRLSMRTVHLLTRRLSEGGGGFTSAVQIRVVSAESDAAADAAAGLLLGVGGPHVDYRSAAIVHSWPGKGGGIFAGIDSSGHAFIRDNEVALGQLGSFDERSSQSAQLPRVLLQVSAAPSDGDMYILTVRAADPETGAEKCSVSAKVPATRLVGNLALVAHPGQAGTRHAFTDWKITGDKVSAHPEASVGPIICAQHTLSRGTMKMTAQLMPIGQSDPSETTLQIDKGDGWESVAFTQVVKPGYTATFRVPEWNATRDVPYRVIYGATETSSPTTGRVWCGVVRKDPVDKDEVVVAGFTGNHNNAHGMTIRGQRDWTTAMWFPHADLTARVAQRKPDVLFFSGDQFYEGNSPTFADGSNIMLDYLYKWYLWCWAYRDLTKDIPCICIPDDHDVYQGNLWGQGGRKSPGRDHDGGYVHPAEFVMMVERTQTSHLPDPFDPRPIDQGIGVYFAPMTYGRISFAILEDRKFKSGCARPDMPPSKTGRPDHFNDPELDPRTLDIPAVQLLGERQLKFLEAWAADWRGADMKIAVSQTVFANMATNHGGQLARLLADLDSNGWPQTGRNKALQALRKGFAFHLAGDQHLATIVHHGVDEHGDAIWSFAVPSIANFYPRAYAPDNKGKYERPEPDQFTGDRRDGLGNLVTVYAATNPGKKMGHEPAPLHDGMPGYGLVRLNKKERTITMECWPRFADPDNPAHEQYEGWPKTIGQLDNYGRKAFGHLPAIQVEGMSNPVVQVVDESSGETIYAMRVRGTRFQPKVFADGSYTVHVGEQEPKQIKTFSGLKPKQDQQDVVTASF